ncbi:MAG: hypothetical protein ACI4TI_00015 [Christensenellales bacterium]
MKKNDFDAYAKYRFDYKQSKKRSKKHKGFAVFFVLFCLFVVIFFSISFSNFLVVGKVVNAGSTFVQDTKILYALSLNSCSNKSQALELSSEQQKQGGAGFVFESDGKFFVISSIYSSLKDCQKVKQNLSGSGINSDIVKITLLPISIKINLNSSSSTILSQAINSFYENYLTLYKLSIEFDQQKIDVSKLKSSVKNLFESNATILQNFSKCFSTSSNASLLYVKIYLKKANSILENFLSKDESSNLSSEIKQTYCQMINTYFDLCEEIS